MAEQPDAKPKSGCSRAVVMIIASMALLAGGVVALVFVPAYFDMEARGLAAQGVAAGVFVSDQMLAYRLEQGHWPKDTRPYTEAGKRKAPAHVADITAGKEGVVRVGFSAPDRLRGGSIEIETFLKEGRAFRVCRGIGIRDGFLPAPCRTHSEPYPVNSPK